MKKKAALSLSVNAIVVLILAIVMLGLGLGFMRGMFGKVSTQIEEQIATEPEAPKASGGEPITLSRGAVITRAGEQEVIKVGIFNPTDGDWTDAKPEIDCGSDTEDLYITTQSANPKEITQGKSEKFNLLITIPSGKGPDTYLCKMKAVEGTTDTGYEKDLTIKLIQ